MKNLKSKKKILKMKKNTKVGNRVKVDEGKDIIWIINKNKKHDIKKFYVILNRIIETNYWRIARNYIPLKT